MPKWGGCSDAWAREIHRFSESSFEQEQVDLDKGKKETIKRRISLFAHVSQENIVFLFLPVKYQEREDIDYRHCSSVIRNRN